MELVKNLKNGNGLVNNANKRKVPVEPGEENLHKLYNFKVSPGKVLNAIIATDGGSTQTRVIVVDEGNILSFEEKLNTPQVMPSVSKTVPDDRVISAKSKFLYDNMDSTIVNTSPVEGSIVSTARLVRGTKANDVELKENRLKSVTNKTQDTTFYYNLIDGLGYAICQEYGEGIPEKVIVKLAVSLPPDDTKPANLGVLNKNLKEYKWKHNPSGVEITFKFEHILTRTEPEAAIKAYYAMNAEETPEITLHIEGGGRSIGVEILMNGVSLGSAQKALLYGGKQLVGDLQEKYLSVKGNPISTKATEIAMRIGRVRDGDDLINVMDFIYEVKDDFSGRIIDDVIDKVFDGQTQVALRDVSVLSTSGRLFDETILVPLTDEEGVSAEEAAKYPDGISVAQFLGARFAKLSPNSKFVSLKGNYIPAGLILEAIIDFTDLLDGDAEEDEVATLAIEPPLDARIDSTVGTPASDMISSLEVAASSEIVGETEDLSKVTDSTNEDNE